MSVLLCKVLPVPPGTPGGCTHLAVAMAFEAAADAEAWEKDTDTTPAATAWFLAETYAKNGVDDSMVGFAYGVTAMDALGHLLVAVEEGFDGLGDVAIGKLPPKP